MVEEARGEALGQRLQQEDVLTLQGEPPQDARRDDPARVPRDTRGGTPNDDPSTVGKGGGQLWRPVRHRGIGRSMLGAVHFEEGIGVRNADIAHGGEIYVSRRCPCQDLHEDNDARKAGVRAWRSLRMATAFCRM